MYALVATAHSLTRWHDPLSKQMHPSSEIRLMRASSPVQLVHFVMDLGESGDSECLDTTSHYPAQWQRAARTPDGVEYRIRPIRANDPQRERAYIAGLRDKSRL